MKINFLPRLKVMLTLLLIPVFFNYCNQKESLPEGDADNGGLFLPDGFEAVVVADSIGKGRHIAVNDNGDIYMKVRDAEPNSGNIALRDTDGDGKADIIKYFGDYPVDGGYGPTEMRIHKGYLWFSTRSSIYKMKLTPGELVPQSKPELVLFDDFKNDPHGYEHIAKPVVWDGKGNMYIPFGSTTDVCQVKGEILGRVGQFPCPELDEHAGIWQFDENGVNLTQKDGRRYATGIRSVVGFAWNKQSDALYAMQHGRDGFHRPYPQLYTEWQSAVLPSEEFIKVNEGDDFGWPYYYYDQLQDKILLNPEYGGDGINKGSDVDSIARPIMGFPGHFGPNDLLFYEGNQFPEHYKNGAFIAFHGSTIRQPYPQAGYSVCFVPFKDGLPSGPWEVFADGFGGMDAIPNPGDAKHRPCGLAVGPDGSLYVSDEVRGTIWRIMYKGDKKKFGKEQLAKMEQRKETSRNIKNPDEVNDNLDRDLKDAGALLYKQYCETCHQGDGKGDGNRFPPLNGSEWVREKGSLINIVLNGLHGPIVVKGEKWDGNMPAHTSLTDDEIAKILTYVRLSFGNNSSAVREREVAIMRKKTANLNSKK